MKKLKSGYYGLELDKTVGIDAILKIDTIIQTGFDFDMEFRRVNCPIFLESLDYATQRAIFPIIKELRLIYPSYREDLIDVPKIIADKYPLRLRVKEIEFTERHNDPDKEMTIGDIYIKFHNFYGLPLTDLDDEAIINIKNYIKLKTGIKVLGGPK